MTHKFNVKALAHKSMLRFEAAGQEEERTVLLGSSNGDDDNDDGSSQTCSHTHTHSGRHSTQRNVEKFDLQPHRERTKEMVDMVKRC